MEVKLLLYEIKVRHEIANTLAAPRTIVSGVKGSIHYLISSETGLNITELRQFIGKKYFSLQTVSLFVYKMVVDDFT